MRSPRAARPKRSSTSVAERQPSSIVVLTKSIGREHDKMNFLRGTMHMRIRVQTVILGATLLAVSAPPTVAGEDTKACSLLTSAQVSAAVGESVDGGKEVATRTCEWKDASGNKDVLLTILGQMGSLSPVDRFMTSKMEVHGIKKTPVTGVGDDAIFIQMAGRPSLNVRIKNSVFQIRVSGSGVSEEQAKQAETTLAQQVILKL
jgi:hypothetical protein